jgi:TfoX/Sxy family transcriptional regulator of competence genes
MSTNQTTVDFILDQLASLGDTRARKMFGEYALYYRDKVVGLICDDILYIKMTEAGKVFAGELYQEGEAYPGAKASIMIDESQLEDRDWLTKIVRITEENLPTKKKR